MSLSWDDVAASPKYQALDANQQAKAKQQYFNDVVAPRVPPQKRQAAWTQFEAYQPKTGLTAGDVAGGVATKLARGTVGAAVDSTVGAVDTAQRVARRLADPEDFDFGPAVDAVKGGVRYARGLADEVLGGPGNVGEPDLEPTHILVPNVIGKAIDTVAPEGGTVRNVARAMGAVPVTPTSLLFSEPVKDTAGYQKVVQPAVTAVENRIDAMAPARFQRAEQSFARDLDAASDLDDPLQQAKVVASTIISHPAVAGGVIAESAPSMLASVITGRAVVKSGMKLIAAQALESGKSPQLARTLAETWAATRGTKLAAAAVAGNATAQSVSSTTDEVADAIMQTPDDVLQQQSPRYAEARQYATEEQAKRAMIANARTKTANSVALTTGLSSLLTAGFEAKLGLPAAHGVSPNQIGKHILEGIFKEGAQETFESGGEQYGHNVGAIESGADPTRNPMQDVVPQAVLGGAVGSVMGGAAGAAHAVGNLGASAQTPAAASGTEKETVPGQSDSTSPTARDQDMSQAAGSVPDPSATGESGPRPSTGRDDISAAFEKIEEDNDPALEQAQSGERREDPDQSGSVGPGDGIDGGSASQVATGQEEARGRAEAVQPVRGEAGESQLPLDQAAHEAATSPHNDLAEPSTAQKEAGNYRKGHLRLHGLDISIENPKGSTRNGTDRHGNDWSVQIRDHYGYIRGTKGKDKEHIDVYVGPKPLAKTAYVVDQVDPETRKFDEHKVMLGYASENDAREGYHRNYSEDWRGLGAITAVPVDQLKEWLATPQTKPIGKLTKLTAMDDARLKDAGSRRDLEAMAPEAGWAETGGRAVRTADAGGTKQVLAIDDYGRPTGDIVGRTKWIPNAPWFPAVQREARLPGNEDGKATKEAVRKAIVGEPMTTAEKRHVGAILDWADAERSDYEQRGASGIDPFALAGASADSDAGAGVSLVDEAMVAKAIEIDEAAVERAALQHDDETAFMAAIQGIIDGTGHGQEANRAAGEGRQGVQGSPGQAERAGEPGERGEAPREAGSEVDGRKNLRDVVREDPGVSRASGGHEPRGSGKAEEPLTLDAQTEEDLAVRDQQQREAEAAGRAENRRSAEKLQADKERDNFALTGSDRAADVATAGGQQDLLATSRDTGAEEAALRHARDHVAEVSQDLRDGQSNAILIPMGGDRSGSAARSIKFYETALKEAGFDKHGNDWQNDDGSLFLRSQGDTSAPIVQYKAKNPKPAPVEDVDEAEPSAQTKTTVRRATLTPTRAGVRVEPESEEHGARSEHHPSPPLRIEPFGGKGSLIIVRGETKANKDRIKAIRGALWNRKAEGWTFRADLEPRVREALADLLETPTSGQITDVEDARGTLETTKDEADGKPANTPEPEQLQAGDSGEDRGDGRTGKPDRGSLGKRLAEADEASRGTGQAAGGDSIADGSRAEGPAARSGESVDGRDRDATDRRADGRPAGIVDEPAGDHVISDADEVGEGGEKTKARNNLAAIELVKRLAAEDRAATADERKVLSRYVGWGGLKNVFDPKNSKWSNEHNRLKAALTPAEFDAARASMLDAHYTSLPVVDAMWDAVEHLGFDGGRVLEPSMGTGNFFGRMPPEIRANSVLNGVELDLITGMIAKQLYQTADIAAGKGFQEITYPANSADLVIGNPPFGSQILFDPAMPASTKGFSIHNYFFAKAVETTRPGGLITMVVSHNLMDQRDAAARNWIAERAHLRGAVRLPYTAFLSNAGTEVVTDILFLQKAMPGETPDTSWTQGKDIKLKAADGGDREFSTSSYFHAHPEMVLGTEAATGKMYGRPDQYNVAPHAGADLGEQIKAAVQKLPAGVYVKSERPVDIPAVRDALVPEHTKVYGYFVDSAGNVMQRITDTFDGKQQSQPVEFSDKTSPRRAAGMVGVRDALRELMRAEMTEGSSDRELASLRKSLNQTYDAFVKQFGYINSQTNRRAFRDDPDLPLLESLEPKYDPGISKEVAKKREIEPRAASAGKADIFSKRVLSPSALVTRVSTAKDALIASMNAHGGVDPAYMTELYGKDFDLIASELGDLIYQDPENKTWEASDAYLSGNVKYKLKLAKTAATQDHRFARNVAALEAVQPVDVPALKIGVRLGSPWVPNDTIEDFARSLLGASAKPVARYVRAVGRWSIDVLGADQAASISRWGTERVPAAAVMSAVMNNKQILVKDNVGTSKEPVWVVNEPETEAARARAEEMAAKFKEWIWEDETRRTRLERLYNDGYNTDRRREYDGSHLTLPGSSPAIQLLQHQKSGVWRGIQEPDLLLDHVVGAGKTFEMAAIAMELRRLGIARKPTFTVPNHLVRQWRDEIYKLYPNANVLAATEADFEKKNRKRLFGKIATGDWDAVIVGHSSFQRIGAPIESQKAILKEQLDEITTAIEDLKTSRGDRNVMRDMERIKQNLASKMEMLVRDAGKKDDVLDFDELGIDALFVDEAHLFKNLFYMSQMRGIAGLGSPAGSGRAFDLFVKTQHLRKRFGKQARVVFATGTPISNSLVEMYTMQRYLAYDELKRRGISTLDAWAGVYGDVQNVYEVHPSGTGYRLKTRFAKFVNLPSLMELYRSFADVVSLDDLKSQAKAQGKRFPVPNISGGRPKNVVADRSPAQTHFFGVPEFSRGQDGGINFKYPADLHPEINGEGKWMLVGSPQYMVKGEERWTTHAGPYESEAEAKEQADSLIRQPVVGYNKDSILWKFENLRDLTKKTNGKINALSVTNEARKAGLDYRLIDPMAPDFEGSKINQAVTEIKRIYDAWHDDRGTQLVFCDLSTPKSARASAATKEKPAFVRDQSGALKRVKATVAAIDGQPVSFLVVKEKPGAFRVHDGLTGAPLPVHAGSREDVVAALRNKLDSGSGWVDDARSRYSEIDDDAVAEWKSQQEDADDSTEEDDSISVGDLMALAGGGKFSVYDDVKAKLIKAGIPEKEVAFIHDYDTAAKKNELYKMVRSGEVRVLLGSTEKMGAGTNVQERLVAEHHLDAPWRPSDLEQREGRIIRQGNSLYQRDPDGFKVEINRYATKQTYDTRMWQLIEHKAAGIEQLRKADASMFEIDDVGGEEANAADMKAAASGNPLILEEIKLRNEVKSLEAQQYAHQSSLMGLQDRLRRARGARARANDEVASFSPLITAGDENPADPFAFAVGKKLYTEKKEAATPLMQAFKEAAQKRTGSVIAGQYRGAAVVFDRGLFGVTAELHAGDGEVKITDYGKDDAFSPLGLITRIDNKLASLEGQKREVLRDAERQEAQIPSLEAEAKRPFQKADELVDRRSAHRKVMNQLAKAGGGISLTPAMQRELKAAIRARLGITEDEDKPNVSAAVRGSADLTRAPLAPAAARAIAEEALGAAGVTNLVRRGILEFVGTVSQMPAALQDYVERFAAENQGREVVALADHGVGRVYIITDRVRAADIPGLVMHEIGEHFGLQEMIGAKDYRRLLGDVRDMHRRGDNKALNDAWDFVSVHYGDMPDTSDEFASEVIARLSESEPFRKTSIWKRLMSWIRQFLFKLGLTKVWRLKDEDLGQMVAAALRRTMMKGTVTPTVDGDVRAAADTAPVYFSQLREVITDKLPKKGGARIFKSMIEAWQRKGEFKKEELDWSGLLDWLDTQKPDLTKADVLAYLAQNQIDVQEVVADDEPGRATAFSQYQLQGGENYRELLLTLPAKDLVTTRPVQSVPGWGDTDGGDVGIEKIGDKGRDYRSGHFNEPNVLAHVRFNERTDANGKKVLFVEEVQSDWHQQGRKSGYGETKTTGWTARNPETGGAAGDFATEAEARAWIDHGPRSDVRGWTPQQVTTSRRRGVPDAPFKQSWPMLAMKRMLRYAADNGFDSVAWTTGEQQASRYDLRQHYDAIWARKNSAGSYDLMARTKGGRQRDIAAGVDAENLADFVGKEIADRIIKGEGTEAPSGYREFSGVDLKVGGEGMQAFYDRELVNDVNRYVKKWGGKVGSTQVQVDALAGRFAGAMLGRGSSAKDSGMATVHSLDLTPEMRAAATRPQPMFAVRPTPSKQQQIEDEAWRKAGMPRDNSTLTQRIDHWATERWSTIKQDLLDNFQSGMFDRFKPIKDAEGNVDPERSGYISARLSTGGSSVLYASMLYGAPELRNGAIQRKEGSRGLLQILEPVADDLNRWAAWMVGKRADYLADQHRENNLNLEEIAYLKSLGDIETRQERYEAVAKEIRGFMTDVLRLMEKSGLLTAEQVTDFSKDAYYLPFYRVDESGDDHVIRPYTKRGLSHQSSQIKHLKGGKTAISDPIENLFAHLSRSIDASMKNYAMARTITNTARHITTAKEGDRANAIRVMWKGKPYWFNVDEPALLRALTAVGEKPRDGLALNIGRSMRSLLTTGITLDPAFMFRNFTRDSMHSWLIDKNSMRFGLDSLKGAKATLKSIRAEAAGRPGDADPAVISMMFAGASFVGGHVYGGDPKANAAAMRKALRRKGMSEQQANGYVDSLVTSTKQFASLYVELGEAIENANRVAVFKAARESGTGLVQALYDSKDLMDFSLRGQWTTIQVLSDILPFFNARLQGLYKLGREARRDPKVLGLVATRIAARGALVALASVALVAAYSGDDRYEELEEWDKDANWHFWVGGVHYRIPKPFELGILFATMPERMYRLAGSYDKFGETVQSIMHNIGSTLAMNPTPQAVRPLLETYFNFDMFRGRPIESAADQARLPEDRYNASTSPTMVEAGKITGVSPKKLEYWWNGYLGTLGTYALMVPDTLVRVARGDVSPAKHIEDYPIIGSFARTGPAWNTEYLTELYDLAHEAEQTNRSLRDKYAEGEDAAGDRIAEDKEGLLSARKMLNRATDHISKLRKQRDIILRDHDITPAEKRDQLDEIQIEINAAAEEAMKSAQEMGAAP